jgi:hypothetical protein
MAATSEFGRTPTAQPADQVPSLRGGQIAVKADPSGSLPTATTQLASPAMFRGSPIPLEALRRLPRVGDARPAALAATANVGEPGSAAAKNAGVDLIAETPFPVPPRTGVRELSTPGHEAAGVGKQLQQPRSVAPAAPPVLSQTVHRLNQGLRDELLHPHLLAASRLIDDPLAGYEGGIVPRELTDSLSLPVNSPAEIQAPATGELRCQVPLLPITNGPFHGSSADPAAVFTARGIPINHDREFCDDCSTGLAACGVTSCCTPCWRFQADALFLDRVGGSHEPIASCTCDDETLVAVAEGFDPYIQAGPRFHLYRDVGPCCGPSWDAEYFMINQWSRVRNFGGDLTLLGTAIGEGTATVRYDSRLQSAQINASRPLGNWARHFVGFRWLSLDEDATVSGSGTIVPDFFQMATTSNDLYGGHYGLQRTIWDAGGCFTLDLLGRAGLFYNSIHRDAVGFGTASLDDSKTSFVGDLQLAGHYDLHDCWRLEIGYQLIWITNVALAIDQFSSPSMIDTGDLFLHGAFVGTSYRW